MLRMLPSSRWAQNRKWSVLLSLMAVASTCAFTPVNFKWGQDEGSLFVTVLRAAETVDFAQDRVALSGQVPQPWTLEFELREDIIPGESYWKHVKDGTFLVLKKQFPHYFDRLLQNSTQFKGQVSIDWKRFEGKKPKPKHKEKDAEESEPSSDEDEDDEYADLESTRFIKVVTGQQAASKAKKHAVVVLQVVFPWCEDCTFARSDLEKVAKKLTKKERKKYFFGVMDARDNKEMARRHNVGCGGNYTCDFVIIKQDQERTLAGDDAEIMGANLRRLLEPSLPTVQSWHELEERPPPHVGVTLPATPAPAPVRQAAFATAERVSWAVLEDPSSGAQMEIRTEDSVFKSALDGKSESDIVRLIEVHSLPDVNRFTVDLPQRIDKLPQLQATLWIGKKDDEAKWTDVLRPLASRLKGQAIFVIRKVDDVSEAEMELGDAGLYPEYPAFVVTDPGPSLQTSPKYHALPTQGATLTIASVTAHVEKCIAGACEQTFQTAPQPREDDNDYRGSIKTVVWKEFHLHLEAENPRGTLLLLFQSWDGEERAKAMMETLVHLSQVLDDIKSAPSPPALPSIAFMDAGRNYIPKSLFDHDVEQPDWSLFWVRPNLTGTLKLEVTDGDDVIKFLKQKFEIDVSSVQKALHDQATHEPHPALPALPRPESVSMPDSIPGQDSEDEDMFDEATDEDAAENAKAPSIADELDTILKDEL